MGKRKKSSRKPQGPKKKEPLATSFPCLFCNHEKSVAVKLDKKAGAGLLTCKVCGQSFQTGINYLSAAVDVYAEWIDACDAVAKNDARNADGRGRPFPDEDGQDGPRATGEYVPGGDYDEYGEEGIEGAGREKELYADE